MSLTNEITLWIVSLFQFYGQLGVFIAVFLEELIVPFPSQLILMAAGFSLVSVSSSLFDASISLIYNVVIPASIAGTLGAVIVYYAGYYGGKPFIEKYKNYLGIDWKQIKNTSNKLGKGNKLWAALFLSRTIPLLPVFLFSIVFGVLRVDVRKYTIVTLLGQIPRTFVLGFAGWYLGSAYIKFSESLGSMQDIILIIAILVLAIWLLRNYFSRILARLI